MTDFRALQKVLDKIEILNLKYSSIYSENSFNIFRILKKGSDEVNVHSNFISELLNPKGSHGKRDVFLKFFVENILNIPYSNLGRHILTKPEHQKIDIYIEFDKAVFIIENKIYAKDRDKQLMSYHDYAKQKRKSIYVSYLTLHKTEPSKDSLGDLSIEDVILISYKNEIIKWLSFCIKESTLNPQLRESISQYLDLVKILIGQSMREEKMQEIINILKKGDNAKNALQIQQNWIHAKWYAQKYFWETLESQLIEYGYEKLTVPDHNYTPSHITGYVHAKKNRKKYYGVLVGVKNLDNQHDICLYIQIGDSDDLYYGLGIVKDKTIRIARKENDFPELLNKIKENNLSPPNQSWITAIRKIPLNFNSFNDEDTVSILNDEFRNAFVKSLIIEMKNFADEALSEE
jgi:hypothetical protein